MIINEEVCVCARGLVAAATTYGGAHGAGVGDGDGSSVGNRHPKIKNQPQPTPMVVSAKPCPRCLEIPEGSPSKIFNFERE